MKKLFASPSHQHVQNERHEVENQQNWNGLVACVAFVLLLLTDWILPLVPGLGLAEILGQLYFLRGGLMGDSRLLFTPALLRGSGLFR